MLNGAIVAISLVTVGVFAVGFGCLFYYAGHFTPAPVTPRSQSFDPFAPSPRPAGDGTTHIGALVLIVGAGLLGAGLAVAAAVRWLW